MRKSKKTYINLQNFTQPNCLLIQLNPFQNQTKYYLIPTNMNTKFTVLLIVITLCEGFQICIAQTEIEKKSLQSLPAFIKKLQKNNPPKELMYSDPLLYTHLLEKQQTYAQLLIEAVTKHQLPTSALEYLHPQQKIPIENNNLKANNASASNFHLVKNINQSKNSNPYNDITLIQIVMLC